jgi:hypothetical protein
MKSKTLAWLIRQGGELASDGLRMYMANQSRVAIQNKIVEEKVASPLTAHQELQEKSYPSDNFTKQIQKPSGVLVASDITTATEVTENVTEIAEIIEPGLPSQEQTLAYQNDHITNQLLLMAVHYTEKLKMNGIPCDCLPKKHFKLLKAFIKETIPMVEDPDVLYRLLDWLEEVGTKSSYEANKSGVYDNEYPRMAYEARNFVKEIDPDKESTSLSPREEAVITGLDILPVVSDEEKERIRKIAHQKIEEALA